MFHPSNKMLLKAALLAALWGSASALTQSKERELRSLARTWILNNPGARTGDTVGALVRLGFHDAGTFDQATGTGGAHGCIMDMCTVKDACEFTADENHGLEFVVRGINGLYFQNQLEQHLSKADFLHLTVAVAVEVASNGAISMPFRWGRTDCSISPPRLPGALPGANWGRSKITNFFGRRLGMSETETIALIGAHSLGRCDAGFSGFEGAWTTTPATLDNQYFKDLVNENLIWDRETVPSTGNRQWNIRGARGNRDTMMLNADVGMFWEVCGENPRACGNCAITHRDGSCAKIDATLNIARRFANSNAAFLSQFRSSFIKLQEKVQPGTTLKRSCSETGGVQETLCRRGEPTTTTSSATPSAPAAPPAGSSPGGDSPTVGTSGRTDGGDSDTTFVTQDAPSTPTTAPTSDIPAMEPQPHDLTSLLQSLLNAMRGTSTDEVDSDVAKEEPTAPVAPALDDSCPAGLLETDVNANGVLDCLERNAPCNPTPCPENSVLCGNGVGCAPEGDMKACHISERVACPSGFATCGDGHCVFFEALCGTAGVRFPANRCAAL